uniref:ER lumen protein-retaining receptor n=1 Tax=Salix viminalis TaxID=40686 RepID=A0A6N2LTW0_SALVM
MGEKRAPPVNVLFGLVRRQSMRVKIFAGVVLALCSLVALKHLVRDHEYFFIFSEAIHAAGIFVLIYKLTTHKNCSGLSLKTQEITALFLAARLACSVLMELDAHAALDIASLISTAWVVPCIVLALIVNPFTRYSYFSQVLWAFCVFLESVSVLPQLRLMQNAKMIEPFTAHYVFALGAARFLSCAHWIIQVYETRGMYLFLTGSGYFWLPAALLAEAVQTFILADFCYYYVKSFMQGQLLTRIPV